MRIYIPICICMYIHIFGIYIYIYPCIYTYTLHIRQSMPPAAPVFADCKRVFSVNIYMNIHTYTYTCVRGFTYICI